MLLLLGLALLLLPQRNVWVSDGKELIKYWQGNMVNTITNVKITMSNGTVVFDGALPESNVIDVKGVWHGQTASIVWTDAEGRHSETVGPIGCDNGVYSVTNTVNHTPKSEPKNK